MVSIKQSEFSLYLSTECAYELSIRLNSIQKNINKLTQINFYLVGIIIDKALLIAFIDRLLFL